MVNTYADSTMQWGHLKVALVLNTRTSEQNFKWVQCSQKSHFAQETNTILWHCLSSTGCQSLQTQHFSSSSFPSSISVATESSAIRLASPPVLLKPEVLGVGWINFDVFFTTFWYRFHKFLWVWWFTLSFLCCRFFHNVSIPFLKEISCQKWWDEFSFRFTH